MGKEIILPWSCKTSIKIQIGLAITSLIGFPLLTVAIFYFGLQQKDFLMIELYALGFIASLLASVLVWFCGFLLWGLDELLPTFKCKRQNDEVVN